MAVEIKYVVVRKGEEKMTFASKKDADAYDKMLDMAEVFSDWLSGAPCDMEDQQREALGMFFAENKEVVQHILRTSKLPEQAGVVEEGKGDEATERNEEDSAVEMTEAAVADQQAEKPAKSGRSSKAA
ncbi:hypothetical protein EH228_14380 [Erwinia endophytica]|uniref:YebG family protein n=1 Tax=Erwinia endophytica TaxID=1563158 RepID=UPI001265DE74|nr:YebG family protein [Erwinia endophytica]KAB8307889.1 hypothetical protein EH228_14380 [Erwinia endophytica]